MTTVTGDLLKEIEEIANLGVYEMDLITGTWTGSENFIKIFGLPVKENYTQEEFLSIVHPEDIGAVMAYYSECLKTKDHFNYEYRVIRPDEKVLFISSKSRIFRDSSGTPVRVLGIKQNLTQKKADELQLEQLSRVNLEKNEVLTMVAHDLKSPINQIKALVSLLKRDANPEQAQLLAILENSAQNGLNIISDLIDIAQLEQGVNLKLVRTDINNLVIKSLSHFEYIAQHKNISLITSLCADATALIHRAKFQRVIDNLLSNAIKFSPQCTSVEITTKRQNGAIELSVKDHGLGIKKENISKLFNKFSKLRRRGTKGEHSTGLGLSIVYDIIKKHDGEITVESEVNKGTTFTIRLKAR